MHKTNKINGLHNCFLCCETYQGLDFNCPLYHRLKESEQCVYSKVACTDMQKHAKGNPNITLGTMLMSYMEYKNK